MIRAYPAPPLLRWYVRGMSSHEPLSGVSADSQSASAGEVWISAGLATAAFITVFDQTSDSTWNLDDNSDRLADLLVDLDVRSKYALGITAVVAVAIQGDQHGRWTSIIDGIHGPAAGSVARPPLLLGRTATARTGPSSVRHPTTAADRAHLGPGANLESTHRDVRPAAWGPRTSVRATASPT